MKRNQIDLKGGRLPSLMVHMINRRAAIVVILFSAFLFTGCSGLFEDPREQANEAVAEANESIAEHNRLFERARSTYADVKEKVESGDNPAGERERITEAKDTLEEARGRLQEAKESLDGVQDLEVDDTVKRYARLLSGAMEAQISAEAREIEFYGILEDDPALENRRQEALDLLSEVGDGYAEAEDAYGRARELANNNPDVLGPGSGSPES